ncbi:MAG: TolC family protein [Petrimonas sp.]|nr:TolC family protein [Petrimonas sp.]
MIRKNLIIASIACLICVSAQAQENYTLERCKQLALENNVKVQNAQLSLEAAGQAKKEAFTQYFPSVSATGIGFYSTEPMMELGGMGMLEKGMLGMVSASQTIYAGGQIVTGNKLARVQSQVGQLQKIMSDDEVLLTTEQYYWQVVVLEEKMKTVAEADTLLASIYGNVNNSYETGMANRNDLLKVELKQNELESTRLKLENGLRLAKMLLGQYIGIPAHEFEINHSLGEPGVSPYTVRVDHLSVLSQRAEYQLLDKNIEANRLQVRMEIGKNLPTIAANVGWSYMNFDKGSPAAMKSNFGMAFATVSIPISGWWGGSHAIKRQKLQVLMAENDKRDAAELLLIQMQQLWNDLEEAYVQIILAEKTIASALENVRLNDDYYKVGTGLLTDLLDAQSALQQARDQYTEATTGYQMKLSRYKQATAQ